MNERLVVSTVVETLSRNGALKVDELLKAVQKLHSSVDERFFEETLMVMELHGLINVYKMTRGKRRVELKKG
jgi:hypothetical protein